MRTMVDVTPVISYAIGTVMLFGAGVYAVKNYRITHEISQYWLVYAIAMFVGGLQTLIYTFEFLYGIDPVLDSVRAGLAGLFAIMLVVVAVEMVTTDIAQVLE